MNTYIQRINTHDAVAERHAFALKESGNYWLQKKKLEADVLSNKITVQNLSQYARGVFYAQGGYGQTVENHSVNASIDGIDIDDNSSSEETTDTLFRMSSSLQSLIQQRISRYSIESCTSFMRKKDSNEIYIESLPEKLQSRIGNSNSVKQKARQLYNTDELLELIHVIFLDYHKSPQRVFPYICPSPEEMKYLFRELHPMFEHVGLEELLGETNDIPEEFESLRIFIGERILRTGALSAARQYARYGIPSCLRPQFWHLILSGKTIESNAQIASRMYQSLNNLVENYELFVDRILKEDAKRCQDDDHYFVFEEMVTKLLLLWGREFCLHSHVPSTQHQSSENLSSFDHDKQSKQIPVGNLIVIDKKLKSPTYPIDGISAYTMPIAYLYEDLGTAYYVFQTMYQKYFNRLHSISSSKESLVHLCLTFDSILKHADPVLYNHFASVLDSSPLDIAFKWIVFGFVGKLDAAQVLLLWDRILGYDSLLLLPLTAASIILFRRDLVLECRTIKEVHSCFDDISHFQWLPLVQFTLFLLNSFV